MLMDEPFGAIDPITRTHLQDEFLRILHDLRKTIVFVTHDIDEAIRMGDRIAILKDGALVQYDTPEAILAAPADAFVEAFVGADRALKRLALIPASAAIGHNGRAAASGADASRHRKPARRARAHAVARRRYARCDGARRRGDRRAHAGCDSRRTRTTSASRRSIDSARAHPYACRLTVRSDHREIAPCRRHTHALAAALAVRRFHDLTASAQETKVAIGMSGWTGFAPLTLAKEAGIFKKNGLDVTLKMIPQKDRHLAIASGDVQCAATTVETWIVWNAGGVATKQIFQMDKSYGADGMAVRNNIAKIADLKGKTVAASAPGTAPYFTLAWFLKKNGLSVKDVTVVNLEPAAGRAGVRRRPERRGDDLRAVSVDGARCSPQSGKIIATTLDYPMIMDTFGCTPKFLADNPKAAQALANSYFEAVDMIRKEPAKSFEIMGAPTKQTGEQFAKSAAYLRWQDKAANQKFFAGEIPAVQQGRGGRAARGGHRASSRRT